MASLRRKVRLLNVTSEKHETSWSNLSQDASSAVEVTILTGVVDANVNLGTECEIGSKLDWIYLEFNCAAETVTSAKVLHWFVAKKPFGTALSNPNTYYQTDKRFIVKRGMEMLPKDVSTVYKRGMYIKVPRSMRKVGRDDTFVFKYICSSAEAINMCGFTVCKPIN